MITRVETVTHRLVKRLKIENTMFSSDPSLFIRDTSIGEGIHHSRMETFPRQI